jgi:hypothetical protein
LIHLKSVRVRSYSFRCYFYTISHKELLSSNLWVNTLFIVTSHHFIMIASCLSFTTVLLITFNHYCYKHFFKTVYMMLKDTFVRWCVFAALADVAVKIFLRGFHFWFTLLLLVVLIDRSNWRTSIVCMLLRVILYRVHAHGIYGIEGCCFQFELLDVAQCCECCMWQRVWLPQITEDLPFQGRWDGWTLENYVRTDDWQCHYNQSRCSYLCCTKQGRKLCSNRWLAISF